ncbi:MAG TPA: ScyD/ScyE family protein [Gemmatimonadaceae bacterium]|nr:ScyD/ScyE family protein [Gemmatimonadaceae bacterium]
MKPITALAVASLVLASCDESSTEMVNGPPVPTRVHAVLSVSDAEIAMHGLNNPRGLAFGPNGALYVAEAGRGGTGPCLVNAQQVCYGPTGAVGRLYKGKQDTVVTGLPSYANAAGRAEGPNAIAFLGNGGAYISVGLETDPNLRSAAPEFAGFARLVHVAPTAFVSGKGDPQSQRRWDFVADIGTYEIDSNPDCGRIDSNPFDVLATPGGVLVVDAGGNSIVRRDANGELSTFVAFSSRYTTPQGPHCPVIPVNTSPSETVPTSIVKGPDGAYYVGQLAGFPLVVGAAKVYRVVPGSAPTVFLSGFTFIIALAFDAHDNLYVLQHTDGPSGAAAGSLIRVTPEGVRTTVVNGLIRPTGLAIGADGAIYISHRGISIAAGEVLRFRL